VARALAADPPILLMDEPFGALDPITRRELQTELKSLQNEVHKTIVFVTHDIAEAVLLGDRIALLEAGRLAWLGPAAEFAETNDATVVSFREGRR
jgi:osmoprotectant transport system ATP-binding protein